MVTDYKEILDKIPFEELRFHLTNIFQKDIGSTFRYIKELESIKFDEEQQNEFKKVPYPEFVLDENGRLVRGKYVEILIKNN